MRGTGTEVTPLTIDGTRQRMWVVVDPSDGTLHSNDVSSEFDDDYEAVTVFTSARTARRAAAHSVLRDDAERLEPLEVAIVTATAADVYERALERVEELRSLLLRIAKWDHLDTAADGAYWRGEIAAMLAMGRSTEGQS